MIETEWYGGILDISAAVRKYFGLEYSGTPDPLLLEWLNRNQFKTVCVILLDALGTSILGKSAEKDGFFRSHIVKSVSTVFPPTTTAATTAFLTGKWPLETAWLGWNQHFSEKDDQIILFREQSQYMNAVYPGFVKQALPVKWIMDELNEKGIKADSVWPAFGTSRPSEDFDAFCANILEACSDHECRFVYGYWDEPDAYLHEHGPSDPTVPAFIHEMDRKIASMAEKLDQETGLIIIADHSQVDIEHYSLDEDLELCACLRERPSIEARCVSFRIQPGKHEEFERLFRERFGNAFALYSCKEAAASGLFGKGRPHERFEEFLGDYVGISLTPLQLDYKKGKADRGNHAGGMHEEAVIPLILYPRL